MKLKSVKQLIEDCNFSIKTVNFLKKLKPCNGELLRLKNSKQFVGYGRLEDGTAIRIEAFRQKPNESDNENIVEKLKIQCVQIPATSFDGKNIGVEL